MFHLPTKGGKNVVNIMKNPAIKRDIQEITIYAYKGEKVKQALRRDGRLLSAVIKNNRVLYRTENEVTTEMSDLVDDLDGKTFKIIHDKSSLPESLDDAYEAENEPGTSDTNGSQISEMNAGQVPPQQSTTQVVSDNVPKEKPKEDDNKTSENMLRKIPDSKMMQEKLSSDFQCVVEGKKTERGSKLSRTQNLFRVEFGKNAQACRKVKTMRRLMDLSNSVCQVRINGNPGGSGFLLFDSFVLTNAHVVSNIYERSRQLDEKVTVHFSYESLEPMAAGFTVMEVVGYEHFQDESGNTYDWVLLRLHADENLPAGLLPNFGFIPQSGGICIIGHPDGGIKKIDPCMVIPTENRPQVVERHYHENPGGVVVDNSHYKGGQGLVHLLTDQFFGCVGGVQHNRQDLTYETSFYFGSSGSPVFDEHCNVVAMHSGGFSYSNARGELQSVLEYGHPLSTIMEHAIIQLVEKGRFDVLEKYLACPYARHQTVMSNVKALVERRNNTSFKCAVSINMAIYESDESLKTFLNFFNLKVEPVQMEID
ncbi:serine protease FAM111A-like [Centropristis striata]|uniref:serine protease FAM111A-like n=1 Tax=Centropristis striata TaxID=184440 RepID=UPI0027E1A870|nr:serine protease FAM111A-like [Centropristis striata]